MAGNRSGLVAASDIPFRPNVGPRDALTDDYDPKVDYVPDIDSKGYHVGLVRQPVRALVDPDTGQVVAFETVEAGEVDEADRPFGPTLSDLKRAHNREEKGWTEGQQFTAFAGPRTPTTVASETGSASPAAHARIAELEAELQAIRAEPASQGGQSEGDKLTGDELEAALSKHGIDATTGGSNADGSMSADEKRAAIAQAGG